MATRLTGGNAGAARLRKQLRPDSKMTERRLEAAGIDTMVLECGQGPPLVLLHGPGEFAETWFEVMPALATSHAVVVPDLPGHGVSGGVDDVNTDRVGGHVAR